MPGEKVQCTRCSKDMRRDNLIRHQSCIVDSVMAGVKRAGLEDTEIKFGGDHQPRNLKIQKLVGKIINDGTRPHSVQRKRLFDDSDELFTADQER